MIIFITVVQTSEDKGSMTQSSTHTSWFKGPGVIIPPLGFFYVTVFCVGGGVLIWNYQTRYWTYSVFTKNLNIFRIPSLSHEKVQKTATFQDFDYQKLIFMKYKYYIQRQHAKIHQKKYFSLWNISHQNFACRGVQVKL